jgi:hypothetical protein
MCSVLIHPNRAMAAAPRLRDGGLVVALLILAVGAEATLKVWPIKGWTSAPYALAGAALGILAAWLGLTLLLHLVARILGGAGSYRALLALMGLAATPMILTSLVSSALYIVLPGLWPELGGAGWEPLHTLIGWAGMTWGWPGLLSYYALRHGEGLSPRRAGGTVVAVYLLTLVGWFLLVLVPGWFG